MLGFGVLSLAPHHLQLYLNPIATTHPLSNGASTRVSTPSPASRGACKYYIKWVDLGVHAPPQHREHALINMFRCFIHLPFLPFLPSSVLPSVSTGKALAMANSTLFSQAHGKDRFAVSDVAYGYSGLVMVDPYDQVSYTLYTLYTLHTVYTLYSSTTFSVAKFRTEM